MIIIVYSKEKKTQAVKVDRCKKINIFQGEMWKHCPLPYVFIRDPYALVKLIQVLAMDKPTNHHHKNHISNQVSQTAVWRKITATTTNYTGQYDKDKLQFLLPLH